MTSSVTERFADIWCDRCGAMTAHMLSGGSWRCDVAGCGATTEMPEAGADSPVVAASGPVDLTLLLDEVAAFVRRYVVVTTSQLVAVTLWVAHTYATDNFDVTPYLAVTSPERRSGKTRLLDVLELLVARPWRAIEPSDAVVFRKIDREMPTLLLDEVDAVFARGREYEALRAILNAGNARGTRVPRCVGPSQALADFSVFCPKALAGIGDLPDTVADRAIPVVMQRKVHSEICERFRRRRAQVAAGELHRDLASWGASSVEQLRSALERVASLADEAEPLAVLDDRAFESWEPLLAIAALAGTSWKERACAAALELSAGRDAEPESPGLRLLVDVRLVFERHSFDRIASQVLAAELASDADSPWADWRGKPVTPRQIATLLRPYGIRPRGSASRTARRRRATCASNSKTPGTATHPRPPPQIRNNRHRPATMRA